MPAGKEIRAKIKSIGNTRKITKAMEMVAASKMRRAQERMHAARPYAEAARAIVGHLARAHSEYRHPYLTERPVQAVCYVVVSTDRGLCGGLNTNLFRNVVGAMGDHQKAGTALALASIGKKSAGFFRRLKTDIICEASDFGAAPELAELLGVLNVVREHYESGRADRVMLCYNRFVNTMTQQPVVEQLLPLPPESTDAQSNHWDYLYEPEAGPVLDLLLRRYLESLLYQAVSENFACEQAARMISMKAATDNAGKLIDELQLVYNKARQAAITQELSEIVGGAAAV